MTKSTNHPDADYTPRDMGPTQRQLEITPEEIQTAWDNIYDDETNDMIMRERKIF